MEELKSAFLDELCQVHAEATGPVMICGDFNQIYRATDKNNNCLNLCSMRCFQCLLDDCQLQELYLHGRLYTSTNERQRATLERIDRAFALIDWLETFPSHHLRCLSSDCLDHVPLLL